MIQLKDRCLLHLINRIKETDNNNSIEIDNDNEENNLIYKILYKDYCNNNNNNEKESSLPSSSSSSSSPIIYLPLHIIEDLVKMIKKIDKWKYNNQFLNYLTSYSTLDTLDLSNETNIDFKQWCKYLVASSNLSPTPTNEPKSICYSLTELNLSYLSNNIEDNELISIISQMKILKRLNVSHCTALKGTFLSNQKQLSSITYLNVRGCSSIIFNELTNVNISNIKELILSKTNINDESLCKLIIGGSDKEDCDNPFREYGLQCLEKLKLSHCNLISSQGLIYLGSKYTPKLESLSLCHCEEINRPNSLNVLKHCTMLKQLHLSHCFINDRSFGDCLSYIGGTLTELYLRHNQLSPQFLQTISAIPSLRNGIKVLDLRESQLIKPQHALCLYKQPIMKIKNEKADSQIEEEESEDNGEIEHFYISSQMTRRSGLIDSHHQNNCKINLRELYIQQNQPKINQHEINLSRSGMVATILTKQQNHPLILLGEDETMQARIVKNVLERRSFDVRIASNGKDAFEMYCQTPLFVLVMMDIFMPILDGLTSIRMIRQYEKTTNRKRTPIIICSASDSTLNNSSGDGDRDSNGILQEYNNGGGVDDRQIVGGDAFISKPLRPNLVDIVINLIKSKC